MIEIKNEFDVGEIVLDELTTKKVKVIGISFHRGRHVNSKIEASDTLGYWVDHIYLGGGRNPWELSKLKD